MTTTACFVQTEILTLGQYKRMLFCGKFKMLIFNSPTKASLNIRVTETKV